MIGVSSYPELFTTLIGWQQYQNLWDIITETGLVFVPFIIMIIKNTTEPFLSQEAKSAYTISLRRVEYGMATMILSIMIVCQPMMTIDPQVLHFQPECDQSVDATPGNSGTTYDHAFGNIPSVKVPLWWYAVIGISHGFNAAATVMLGCPINLREVEMQIDTSRIQSLAVQTQVVDFTKACYEPALRKYQQLNASDQAQYAQTYGVDDTSWIGSKTFQSAAGYYDSFKAPKPIEGFAYDPQTNWDQGQNNQQWGAPTCADWWSSPKIGLEDQLTANINPSAWNYIKSLANSEKAKEYAIQDLLKNTFTSGYKDNAQIASLGGGGYVSEFSAGIGTWIQSLSLIPKIYSVIEALPLIQSILLMLCYAFLGVALTVCSFNFKAVMRVSFIIFSIISWTFLWKLIAFVDNGIMAALDPGATWLTSAPQVNNGGDPDVSSIVMLLAYVGVPVIWTMIMNVVGVNAGSGLNSLIDQAAGSVGSVSPMSAVSSIGGAAGHISGSMAASSAATPNPYRHM